MSDTRYRVVAMYKDGGTKIISEEALWSDLDAAKGYAEYFRDHRGHLYRDIWVEQCTWERVAK